MKYIKVSNVKKKIHGGGKQITKDGLYAIDLEVEFFLERLVRQFNGHKRRINMQDVTFLKMGGSKDGK